MDPDSARPISIFACESQPVVIAGLTAALPGFADLRLAGHAEDIEGAAAADGYDVLLVGQPPAMRSALPLLADLRAAGLNVPVVIWVAGMSEMDVFRALQMGARGIILRTQTLEDLAACIRSVHQGQVWLDASLNSRYVPFHEGIRITPREREIIELVCQGLKNRDIAEAMAITPGTVKVHLMHIFEKSGVQDRFQLALHARQILASAITGARSRSMGA